MTAAIDPAILTLLAEHGSMTASDMCPHIYPDIPSWEKSERTQYIYARCAHLMRDDKVSKTMQGRRAYWSLAGVKV